MAVKKSSGKKFTPIDPKKLLLNAAESKKKSVENTLENAKRSALEKLRYAAATGNDKTYTISSSNKFTPVQTKTVLDNSVTRQKTALERLKTAVGTAATKKVQFTTPQEQMRANTGIKSQSFVSKDEYKELSPAYGSALNRMISSVRNDKMLYDPEQQFTSGNEFAYSDQYLQDMIAEKTGKLNGYKDSVSANIEKANAEMERDKSTSFRFNPAKIAGLYQGNKSEGGYSIEQVQKAMDALEKDNAQMAGLDQARLDKNVEIARNTDFADLFHVEGTGTVYDRIMNHIAPKLKGQGLNGYVWNEAANYTPDADDIAWLADTVLRDDDMKRGSNVVSDELRYISRLQPNSPEWTDAWTKIWNSAVGNTENGAASYQKSTADEAKAYKNAAEDAKRQQEIIDTGVDSGFLNTQAQNIYENYDSMTNQQNGDWRAKDAELYDWINGEGAYEAKRRDIAANSQDPSSDVSAFERWVHEAYMSKEYQGPTFTDEEQVELDKNLKILDDLEAGKPTGNWTYQDQSELEIAQREVNRRAAEAAFESGDYSEYATNKEGGKYRADLFNNRINGIGQYTDSEGNLFRPNTDGYGDDKAYGKEPIDFITPEQKERYNELYAIGEETGDWTAANSYLDIILPQAEYAMLGFMDENTANEYGKRGAVWASAHSLLTNLDSSIEGVANVVGTAFSGETKAYGLNTASTRETQYLRQRAGNDAGQLFADWFGEDARKVGEGLYGVLMSVGDVLVSRAVGLGLGKSFGDAKKFAEPIIQTIMSSEAAANTYYKMAQENADPEQAVIYSVTDGLIEAMTEKYSIEALFSEPKNIKNYLMKNFLAEGSEELAGKLAGTVFDFIYSNITGKEQEVTKDYNDRLGRILSENPEIDQKQAESKAFWETLGNYGLEGLEEFAAGGLAGLLMSSVGAGVNYAQGNIEASQMGKSAKTLGAVSIDENGKVTSNAQTVLNAALSMPKNSASRVLAESVKSADKVSNYKLGRIMQELYLDVNKNGRAVVSGGLRSMMDQSLSGEDISEKARGKMSAILAKVVLEGPNSLSKSEKTLLTSNDKAFSLYSSWVNADAGDAQFVSMMKGLTDAGKSVANYTTIQNQLSAMTNKKLNEAFRYARNVASAVVNADSIENAAASQRHALTQQAISEATGKPAKTGNVVVHGKNGTITKVDTDSNGDVVFEFTDSNGNISTVDSIDIKTENEAVQTALGFAEMNTNLMSGKVYATILGRLTQGNATSKADALDMIRDASVLYNAAFTQAAQPDFGSLSIDTEAAKDIWAEANAAVKAYDELRLSTAGKAARGNGTISYADGMSYDKLTSEQQGQVNALKQLGQVLGYNFELYNGQNSDLGSYDPETGAIRLDVTQKDNGRSSLLVAAGHELTHFIEHNSPVKYNELKSYVISQLREKGVNFNELVQQKMDREAVGKITYGAAVSEVIADACQQILPDSKAIQTLAANNPALTKDVSGFMKKFTNRVKAGLNKLGARTQESSVLMGELGQYNEELARLWDEALIEAVKTRDNTAGTQNNGVKVTVMEHLPADAQFSMRALVEEKSGLSAIHAISSARIPSLMKMGGIPAPSIAIAVTNSESSGKFGDTTFVFDKATIDPVFENNNVWGRDAWTPMFPETKKGILGERIVSTGKKVNARNVVEAMRGKNATSGIYGNLAGKTYLDATMSDVDGMIRNISSEAARKYGNISEIQNDRGRLGTMSAEQIEEEIEKAKTPFMEAANAVIDFYEGQNAFSSDATENDHEKAATVLNIFKSVAQNDQFVSGYLPKNVISKVQNALETIQNIPSQYAEAKPMRVVDYSEVKMAIVPSAATEAIAALKKAGIDVMTYNNDQERISLMNSDAVKRLQFSQREGVKRAVPGIATEEFTPNADQTIAGERPSVIEMPTKPVQNAVRGYRGPRDIKRRNDVFLKETNTQTKDVTMMNGRDVLEYMLKKGGYYQSEINQRLSFMDEVADMMEHWGTKYRYLNLEEVNKATLTKGRDGKWVMTCVVPNAEYPINIDFSTICDKRADMTRLFNELADAPGRKAGESALEEIDLSPSSIKRINQILKEAGYETACFGCFVESKRYSMQAFAQDFCDMYNNAVDEIRKKYGMTGEPGKIGFAKSENISENDILKLEKSLEKYNSSKGGIKKSGSVQQRIYTLLDQLGKANDETMLKYLTIPDLITSNGVDTMARKSRELMAIFNSHYGQGRPKNISAYVPYHSEIATFSKSRNAIIKAGGYNAKDVAKLSNEELLQDYIRKIGGVRNQSFSDFVPTQLFDALQMLADCEARGFNGQCYTKNASRAWLMGMCNFKTNLSLMFLVDSKVDGAHAGLDANGDYMYADYAHLKNDPDWRKDPTKQTQSIGYEDAKKIETSGLHAASCGAIGVGHSYHHIKRMLSDFYVPYIIPYHRSAMPVEVASETNLFKSANYEPVQNTLKMPKAFMRVENWKDFDAPSYATWSMEMATDGSSFVKGKNTKLEKNTSPVNEMSPAEWLENDMKKTGDAAESLKNMLQWMGENHYTFSADDKALNGHGDFDVYGSETVGANGKSYSGLEANGNPRETANNYIAWCLENDMMPLFYEFADDPFYFKMLYDFSVMDLSKMTPVDAGDGTGLMTYDPNEEIAYAPQVPVSMDNMLTERGHELFFGKAESMLNRENQEQASLFGLGVQKGDYTSAFGEVDTSAVQSETMKGTMRRLTTDPQLNNRPVTVGVGGRVRIDNTAGVQHAIRDKNGNEYTLTDEQRKDKMYKVANMGSVAEVNDNLFSKDKFGENSIKQPIVDYFNKLGGKAYNKILGDVKLDEKGVKHLISYITSRRTALIAAIKPVIENGEIIHTTTHHTSDAVFDSAIIAAPVKLYGKDYYMGVIVRQNNEKINSYYIHDAVVIEKNRSGSLISSGTNTAVGTEPTIAMILSELADYNVQYGYMRKTTQQNSTSEHFVDADGKKATAEAIEASDVLTQHSLREKDPPKKTIVCYKAFYARDGKLYPPMVSNVTNDEDVTKGSKLTSGTMKGLETPVGVWLDADVGGLDVDENGEPTRTATTGRLRVRNDKGGGSLAFRPGWHLGEWPDATQFNKTDPVTGEAKSVLPDDLVFARCEIAADEDYQLEALELGMNDKGKFNRSQAGLPRVPVDGFYKYRTNADPAQAPWYISGAMIITDILDDEDCRQICAEYGITPGERYSHHDIRLEDFGLKRGPVKQTENLERFRKNKASYDNDALLERALNDERYEEAYRRRDLDFNNPVLLNEFKIDRVSDEQVEEYRKNYKGVQKSIRQDTVIDTREYLNGLDPNDVANAENKEMLTKYQKLYRELKTLESARDRLQEQIMQVKIGKAEELRKQLLALEKKIGNKRNQLNKFENESSFSTTMKQVQSFANEVVTKGSARAMKELGAKQKRYLEQVIGRKFAFKLSEAEQRMRDRIQLDRAVREIRDENFAIQKAIQKKIRGVKNLRLHETDYKNIQEGYKPLADELVRMFIGNDADTTGNLVWSKDVAQQLAAKYEMLGTNEETSDSFSDDVLEALQDAAKAMEDYGDARKTIGMTQREKMLLRHDALYRINKAVQYVYDILMAQGDVFLNGKRMDTEAAGALVIGDANQKEDYKEFTGKAGTLLTGMDKSIRRGNMTPEYFFRNLRNSGLSDINEGFHIGEADYGIGLQEAKEFMDGTREKHGWKDWGNEHLQFRTAQGREVDLTIQQAMSLYATWKREHQKGLIVSQHLENGGYVLDEGSEKQKGLLGRQSMRTSGNIITEADMKRIMDWLTDDQKAYADEMVNYLSTTMGEKGNEASMKLFGIRKYNEKYYFPIRSYQGNMYIRSDAGTVSTTNDARVKHASFTNSRLNNAKNAVLLEDFDTVVANHINQMLVYSNLVVPIESFNRVLNHKFVTEDGSEQTVRSLVTQKYGKNAAEYIQQYLKDLNGGPSIDPRKTWQDRLLSIFKKSAVAGSLSVALQQPLSYIRAGMEIDPKYLTQALASGYKGSYAEMMNYSGVAVIKSMGKFDVGYGYGAVNWLKGEDPNRTKAQKVMDTATEYATILPEKMDQATWTRMWQAVKLEMQADHPNMDPNSENFLKACGNRFNEVMRLTQVYDSVMVRSNNMRSKTDFQKVMTSFMAEPTLTANMLYDAYSRIKEKGGKKLVAKATGIFLISAIAQAAIKGLMSAWRNPDEKKTLEEQLVYKTTQNFMSEANPIGLIPGASTLLDALSGSDIDDSAWSVVTQLGTAISKLNEGISGQAPIDYKWFEETAGLVAQLFTDVPAKNLMRDMRAMYNALTRTGQADRPTSGAVVKGQFREAALKSDLIKLVNDFLTTAGGGVDTTQTGYYEQIYEAQKRGDTARAEELQEFLALGKGTKADTIQSGLKKLVKADEDLTLDDKVKYLTASGMVDDAKAAYNYVGDGYDTLYAGVESNRMTDIKAAVKEMTKYGYKEKDMIKQLTTKYKQAYLNAAGAEKIRLKDALTKAFQACGMTEADAVKKINGWKKE